MDRIEKIVTFHLSVPVLKGNIDNVSTLYVKWVIDCLV
jgi:hypothetical protein